MRCNCDEETFRKAVEAVREAKLGGPSVFTIDKAIRENEASIRLLQFTNEALLMQMLARAV